MALTTSNAKWKIVVGHHTIKSASDHGNTEELVEKVLPILEVCSYIFLGSGGTRNILLEGRLAIIRCGETALLKTALFRGQR